MANNAIVGLLRALLVADTAEFDDAMKRSGDGAQAWGKKLKDVGGQAESVGQQISSSLTESVTKLAAAFSLSHLFDSAIEGILDLGKSAFTTATQIVDLSTKLGLSTDAIQKLDYVGKQTNTTVEDLGQAVFKMGVNIEKGGAAVDNALRTLGLSREQMKALSPEEQFDLVARALSEVTDVQERNRLGVDLMGKSYASVATAVAEYADKVGHATVVDQAHITALHDVTVAYERLKDTIEKGFITAIGTATLGVENLTRAHGGWANVLKEAMVGNLGLAIATGATTEAILREVEARRVDVNLTDEHAKTQTNYTAAMAAARKEIDALLPAQKANIDAGLKIGKTIDDLADEYHLSADAARIYVSYQQEQTKGAKEAAEATKKKEEAEKKWLDTAIKSVEQQQKFQADLDKQTKEIFDKRMAQIAKATDVEAKAYIARVGFAHDQVTAFKSIDEQYSALTESGYDRRMRAADEWRDQQLIALSGLQTTDAALYDAELKKVQAVYQGMAEAAHESIQKQSNDFTEGFDRITAALDDFASVFSSFSNSSSDWAKAFSQDVSSTLGLLKQVRGQLQVNYNSTGQMTGTSFKQNKLGGAMTLGAGALGAVGAVGSGNIMGGAMSGAESGLGLATMMGASIGVGAATMGIGAGVIAAAAAIKHHQNATIKDRQGLATQLGFGDLGALYTDLQKQGAEGANLADVGAHVIGKHDEAANTAWMQQVSDFYDKLHQQQETILSDLGDLDQSFAVLGVTAPAALNDTINALIAAGDTKDAQTGIDGMTAALQRYQDQAGQAEAFKTVEQEMKDVGLTADDMNAKFQQAADEETARTIAKQWADLAPYVSDVNVLAGKFGDSLEKLAKDSLDYGTSIPDSMKPVMQSLIDQGKILDDNGNKITDMGQLNWEKDPLATGLDALNKTLEDLVDVLKNKLPAAAADGAQGMQDAYDRHPLVIPVHYAADDAPSGPSGGGPAPQIGLEGGTHGQYVDWGAGTDVTLHGRERVVPAGEAVGGAAAAPIQITVISTLDGRELARNQVRYIPRELTLAGF